MRFRPVHARGFRVARIDTVVFDLGDVLIPWNPRRLYRKLFPDEASMEKFLAEVCTMEWNNEQDRGRTIEEGTSLLIAAHPQCEGLIRAFYERWTEMLDVVVEGSVRLLRDLKQKGYHVFALTNWSAETFEEARHLYPVLDEFEGILVSGQESIVKPDAAIYRLLCQRYSIVPECAVFIDDNPVNVDGARAIGMKAIRFRNPDQARQELKALGIEV